MQTLDEIRSWLVTHIAEIVGVEPTDIDPRATFESFGLASRDAVSLSGDLEDWLGRRLSPVILYQYPTIEALAAYLAHDHVGPATAGTQRTATDTTQADMGARTAELADLSDEEAEALLLEKLTQLN